ncbi:MAG: hypothetical protein ABRQ37_14535 [Candidatus Eremiobacterota bacterium]
MIDEIKCPECGFINEGNICLNCGANLSVGTLEEKKDLPRGIFCKNCGNQITPGKKFCALCGCNISKSTDGEVKKDLLPPIYKPVKQNFHIFLIAGIIIITGIISVIIVSLCVNNKFMPSLSGTSSPKIPGTATTEKIITPTETEPVISYVPSPVPYVPSPTRKPVIVKISSHNISVTASTVRPKINPTDNYGPENTIDGNRETAWNTNGTEGEWIELTFPESKVCKIGIIPGYDKYKNDKYKDRWRGNNRIRSATLVFSDKKKSLKREFEDKKEMKYFTVEPPVNTDSVTIIINSV